MDDQFCDYGNISNVASLLLVNAESSEAERTDQEEELEKEFLAPKAWRYTAISWPCWRQNHIKGSQNDKDN